MRFGVRRPRGLSMLGWFTRWCTRGESFKFALCYFPSNLRDLSPSEESKRDETLTPVLFVSHPKCRLLRQVLSGWKVAGDRLQQDRSDLRYEDWCEELVSLIGRFSLGFELVLTLLCPFSLPSFQRSSRRHLPYFDRSLHPNHLLQSRRKVPRHRC